MRLKDIFTPTEATGKVVYEDGTTNFGEDGDSEETDPETLPNEASRADDE